MMLAWTVWAMGCLIAMEMQPGRETIPYHLGWAGFALAFGLSNWTRWQLVTALMWYTLATGAALERSWLLGRIGWDETTEIPLMLLLAVLMVWHVRRRQAALGHVTRLAEREVQALFDREQLMRLTSHELRTPLTIAQGYVELMQARSTELESQEDLSVVGDELQRLARVSDRLIRMIRIQEETSTEMVDIDEVMEQAFERWRAVADRRWVLEPGAGQALLSPERLRTGLDTLIENAIRYTSEGDTIRLAGSRQPHQVCVGVFDGGVGLTDEHITAINAGQQPPGHWTTTESTGGDPEGAGAHGTGLGLSIVRALASARGGTLTAAHAPDGGAALVLTFPVRAGAPAAQHGRRPTMDVMTAQPWLSPTQPTLTV